MAIMNGLSTANHGEIVNFNEEDIFNKGFNIALEVLKPEKHNPLYNIVCYYYWDTDIQRKVEVTIYRSLATGRYGSEVYYFKTESETLHYRSRNYIDFIGMPKKQYDIVGYIFKYYTQIFGK